MAQRRPHSKKRTGCINCKKRHIKCDELGPPCANCRVRNVDCGLALPAQNTNSPQPRPQPAAEECPQASVVVVGDRILELELFHRWSTDTCRTFRITSDDIDVWRLMVPQEALRYDFLLNAILSVTALHVATTTSPTRSRAYQLAALEYQNLAINTFQASNLTVTAANHQAMFAFSVLNMALALALPYHLSRDNDLTNIREGLPTMFGLLQGVVSIFASSRTWLSTGAFQGLVARQMPNVPREELDHAHRTAMDHLRLANDEGYRLLCSDPSSSPQKAVSYHESNLAAIEKLEQCFLWNSDADNVVCLRWLATLEGSIIDAISNREPVAMLAIMHWAILLDRLGENRWWGKSCGKLLVTELSMVLNPLKPQWEPAISWVHQQVGLPALA
ncbi:uncharacterized protein PV06_04965 [Exophiala oligosperma]|uniref:Zn(2)-C6 fungal-type domain-containing protein n=1 Tax=Exophiala oligosperma TaxID=215243 RepID=A0A0D2DN80_9EURO|nr:uncharacterized protein PV06_04965 [Exophiala oligosperma]KIW43915.1 hypothetical protein PV06_04965 [Exophiala oligosperma]